MNPFQAQYPLSPRKFWKKFLPSLVTSLVLSVFIGIMAALMALISSTDVSQPVGIFILTFLLLLLVSIAWNVWYFKTYIRTYSYEGGDNFITIKKGVFAPREIHVQYQKIQDVYVDQDILDRIMGLYDVHLASATATSGMEAHIDGVEKDVAEGLKNFLLGRVQGSVSVSAQPMASMGATPAAPVQLNQDVSSTSYPFKSTLLLSQIIGIFFFSLFVGLFFTFFLVPRESDGFSFLQYIPGGFLGAYIIITTLYFILHVIGIIIWDKTYRFQFTPEYILYRTGILSQSETHLPYHSIQDVNVSQTLIERMLGLATVRIENAAQITVGKRTMNGGIKLVGQSPETANQIAEIVKGIILTKNSSQTGL